MLKSEIIILFGLMDLGVLFVKSPLSPLKNFMYFMIRRKCPKIVHALSNYLKVFAELFSKNDPPEAAFLFKVLVSYWNDKIFHT